MRRIPSPVRAGLIWGLLGVLFLGSAVMAQEPVREPIREAFEAALKQYREGTMNRPPPASTKFWRCRRRSRRP